MDTPPVQCRICGQTTASPKGLARHLHVKHPSQTREAYYRLFLMQNTQEGLCGYCGGSTTFKNLTKGFHSYCSVPCARNAPEVIARREATNLGKYGAAYYTQTPGFQVRAAATKQTRYGNAQFRNPAKQRETMLDRYGKEHNWSGPSGTRSCDLTKLKRYGSATYSNVEQGQATRLRLYGDAHFNRAACRATNLERYGVEWPLQNAIILEKNHGFRYHDYTMPSGNVVRVQGYETYALDWLLQRHSEMDILVSKGQVPSFNYVKNNGVHRYFPDAYVVSENLVVEVKSEYTLRQHSDVTCAKLNAVFQAGYRVLLLIVAVRNGAPSYRAVNMDSATDLSVCGIE